MLPSPSVSEVPPNELSPSAPSPARRLLFRFSASGFQKAFLVAIAGLILLHLAANVYWHVLNKGRFTWLLRPFDLDAEYNLPALFQVGQLLLAAGFFLTIGVSTSKSPGQDARPWKWLGGLFAFAATDEYFSFHEGLIGKLGPWVEETGYFRFAWVVPYALLAAGIGVACLRFYLALPWKLRVRLAVASAFYLGGGLGVEMIAGNHVTEHGFANFGYGGLVALEEGMEMVGVLLSNVALLRHLDSQRGEIALRFAG